MSRFPTDILNILIPMLGPRAFALVRSCRVFYTEEWVRKALMTLKQKPDIQYLARLGRRFPKLYNIVPQQITFKAVEKVLIGNGYKCVIIDNSEKTSEGGRFSGLIKDRDDNRKQCRLPCSFDYHVFSPGDEFIAFYSTYHNAYWNKEISDLVFVVRLADYSSFTHRFMEEELQPSPVRQIRIDDDGMIYFLQCESLIVRYNQERERADFEETIVDFRSLTKGLACMLQYSVVILDQDLRTLKTIRGEFLFRNFYCKEWLILLPVYDPQPVAQDLRDLDKPLETFSKFSSRFPAWLMHENWSKGPEWELLTHIITNKTIAKPWFFAELYKYSADMIDDRIIIRFNNIFYEIKLF